MKLSKFALYVWGVLAFNILVVLWGDVVRATGSGAGCGRHWPSCNGEALPQIPQIDTLIEFTHRLTSGVALILVIGLAVWAFRAYPKRHQVRLGAALSLFFIITEALVGAGLVLFGWVANDTSPIRAVVVSIHLTNTFALLGFLTLTAWWASGGKAIQSRGQGWLSWAIGFSLVALFLLGISGAMTALSDTLFPASSLVEGLEQKYDPTAHFLVRLRLLHPIIAIAVGIYLVAVAFIHTNQHPTVTSRRLARLFTAIYVFQLMIGAFNVVLLTPIWLQQVHLLITDIVLIVWVIFVATALAQKESHSLPIKTSEALLSSKKKEVYGH